jgi:hypothetical protein
MFKAFSKRRRPKSHFHHTNSTWQRLRSRRLALESLEPRQMLAAYSVDLISRAAEFSLTAGGASTLGSVGNALNPNSVVSQNGRYVVFESTAENLVSGKTFAPGVKNVYRFDRESGEVALVSINKDGTGGGNSSSSFASISADGSVVAFQSMASDLSPDDTDNGWDVFVREMTAPNVQLISERASVNGGEYPVLSADGSTVAFTSNSLQVYARNWVENTTSLVSVNSDGSGGGNGISGVFRFDELQNSPYRGLAISSNGEVVAFRSEASNLQTAISDTNGRADIYARDIKNGITYFVSASSTSECFDPQISANGQWVAFQSSALNGLGTIVVRELATGVTRNISNEGVYALSANGDVVAFNAPSGNQLGLYTTAVSTGVTTLVAQGGRNPSLSEDGTIVSYSSSDGSRVKDLSTNTTYVVAGPDTPYLTLSADGTTVAFESVNNGLIANDFNQLRDVFLQQLSPNALFLASQSAFTSASAGSETQHVVSRDGRYVAFTSNAPNLVPGVSGGVFRFDRRTGDMAHVGYGSNPSISADGSIVAFDTSNDAGNVLVHDFATNSTHLLSSSGRRPTVSANGKVVAFESGNDIYARDLVTNVTTLVSVNRTGTGGGDRKSLLPVISEDGRIVAYQSTASNLTAAQLAIGIERVYARDLAANTTYLVSISSNGEILPGINPVLSANGNIVAFDYNGGSLVRNLVTNTTVELGGQYPAFSGDGKLVAFARVDTESSGGVYVKDLTTNSPATMVSVDNSGTPLVQPRSFGHLLQILQYARPAVSDDGTAVAFWIGDPQDGQVYSRNLLANQTELVSVDRNGMDASNGGVEVSRLTINADGSAIGFISRASNFVYGDFNDLRDIFVADSNPTSTWITVANSGNLTIADTRPGGKNDNFKISYDTNNSTLIVEDLGGSPINTEVGSGGGSSVVTIPLITFSGNIVFNAGLGDDTLTLDATFNSSGKTVQFNGGAGSNSLVNTVTVNPATINDDLQSAVSALQDSTTNAKTPQVAVSIASTELTTIIGAVNALEPDTEASDVEVEVSLTAADASELTSIINTINESTDPGSLVVPAGVTVEFVVTLADGEYTGQTIDLPAGARLVINSAGGIVTFEGSSPAFTLLSGEIVADELVFVNSTDAPTILVTGGSLTVRNSVIRETTGGARAAIEVTGGTVNLGTLNDPGGNTLVISGTGEFVRNTSSDEVPIFGNAFQTDTATITTNFIVAPHKRLIYDAATGNIVLASTVITVGIDLRPPTININQNGAISLVIFGSLLFDVSQINTSSLKFAGVSIDVFNSTLLDDNKDGNSDLLIHFGTSDALKAALTEMYSDLLLEDDANDGQYSTRQDSLITLDGAFGEFGQEFQGADSTTLFLAGSSLKNLLASLGI